MTVFSDKLDGLPATIKLAGSGDIDNLATALAAARRRVAYAVASGGSAIVAEYFAICRRSLQCAFTIVQTPMHFVLESDRLTNADVWLFSAGGDNPDILAALDAAVARGASTIHVVTTNPRARVRVAAEHYPGTAVHVTSVADPKDGFLATHSLIATVTALLRAADKCLVDPAMPSVGTHFGVEAVRRLSQTNRDELALRVSSFAPADTLVLLADPRLAPAAIAIETSAWEAALCPVQRTDHRNFAHGRHVWVAQRGKGTFILSLAGTETRAVWREMDALLPDSARRLSLDYANCGRLQCALAIVDSLVLVEALGRAVNVDPGSPGVGDFGRKIYQSRSLGTLATHLSPAVRHKQQAMLLRDNPLAAQVDVVHEHAKMLGRLANAVFRGLVLDYDGTIVSTEDRYNPPAPEIIAELRRLLRSNIAIGIATGRGGSAGERLRELLPVEDHPKIVVGYYNGGYVRSLDVDIRRQPAPRHPDLINAMAWLREHPEFFRQFAIKDSGVQVSIEICNLLNPDNFFASFSATTLVRGGAVRLTRSQHSYDVLPAATCKTAVVRAVAQRLGDEAAATLCVGDSGSCAGNDYALLGGTFGVSVCDVSDQPDVCWSFFGQSLTGPSALLRLLQALRADQAGCIRIDIDALQSWSQG
jgi:fructoselysine-6-P-deglycase FrlB-like protein/phosphoglycolate phosphatase-like HAD superfamily hydrolase